jgi:hypothetical protein
MGRVRIEEACSRQNPDVLAAPDLTQCSLPIVIIQHHFGLTSCLAGVWWGLHRCHESPPTPARRARVREAKAMAR